MTDQIHSHDSVFDLKFHVYIRFKEHIFVPTHHTSILQFDAPLEGDLPIFKWHFTSKFQQNYRLTLTVKHEYVFYFIINDQIESSLNFHIYIRFKEHFCSHSMTSKPGYGIIINNQRNRHSNFDIAGQVKSVSVSSNCIIYNTFLYSVSTWCPHSWLSIYFFSTKFVFNNSHFVSELHKT